MNKIVFTALLACSLCVFAQAFPGSPNTEATTENKQSGLSCASVTVAGNVYIMTSDKNYMFCSATDTYIAKASTAYNLEAPQCIWTMTYCTTSSDTLYVYFKHTDNSLVKYLACYRAWVNGAYEYYCQQYEVTDQYSDLGHFFRMDSTTGGNYLYNPTSLYYAKDDGSQLQLSSTAQTVFRMCFTDVDLAYC